VGLKSRRGARRRSSPRRGREPPHAGVWWFKEILTIGVGVEDGAAVTAASDRMAAGRRAHRGVGRAAYCRPYSMLSAIQAIYCPSSAMAVDCADCALRPSDPLEQALHGAGERRAAGPVPRDAYGWSGAPTRTRIAGGPWSGPPGAQASPDDYDPIPGLRRSRNPRTPSKPQIG
jgi:hypothetical protein